MAVPLVLMLHNEEAAVVVRIEGVGRNRIYFLRQIDGLEQQLSHDELVSLYLGYCWFIKPKVTADNRSDLPEYHLPKSWFWKVIWRFKGILLSSYFGNIHYQFLSVG